MTTPNPRIADYPIDRLFVQRHSPRAFSDATMSEVQVLTLLEAGRWSPSASNIQPWRFVHALRGTPAFDAIVASMVPFNQTWAAKAAALVVIGSVKTNVNKEGQTVDNPSAAYDAGQAAFAIALQAHLTGVVSHQMSGLDFDVLGQAIHLPADHQLHAVMALGHSGDAQTLPDYMHAGETPNARRALSASAHRGSF